MFLLFYMIICNCSALSHVLNKFWQTYFVLSQIIKVFRLKCKIVIDNLLQYNFKFWSISHCSQYRHTNYLLSIQTWRYPWAQILSLLATDSHVRTILEKTYTAFYNFLSKSLLSIFLTFVRIIFHISHKFYSQYLIMNCTYAMSVSSYYWATLNFIQHYQFTIAITVTFQSCFVLTVKKIHTSGEHSYINSIYYWSLLWSMLNIFQNRIAWNDHADWFIISDCVITGVCLFQILKTLKMLLYYIWWNKCFVKQFALKHFVTPHRRSNRETKQFQLFIPEKCVFS